MTQEGHWKKAYQDLRIANDVEIRKQADRMQADFNKQKEIADDMVRQLNDSYERERDLANRLQAYLHWIEDDILTSLSDKAVVNIRKALQDFKDTRSVKPIKPKR